MQYQHITSQYDLIAYCDRMAGARRIAFDTEFVSEDSYQPDLCLIQVAADDDLAIIDPKLVDDLRPFWELLASEGHDTIVHAGREEYRFCLATIGRWPHRVYDVQIACALVGLEYPASLQTILSKILGQSLPKFETRTDWRRRPLSRRQLEYALHDVAYLLEVWNEVTARLERLERFAWLDEEMESYRVRLEETEARERWRRVSGLSGLSSRQLAIVREIWRWREARAERRNQIPKRILRDDLVVELARRKTSDAKRIGAVRGFQRRDLQSYLPELAECIERALDLPDDACPQPIRRDSQPQLNVVSQMLATAVANRCRSLQIAPALAGSVQDVRDLVAYRLGVRPAGDGVPLLARGWREGVIGQLVDDLLAGRLVMRITDPLSDDPLSFEPIV